MVLIGARYNNAKVKNISYLKACVASLKNQKKLFPSAIVEKKTEKLFLLIFLSNVTGALNLTR